ncbi:MAG: glutamate--tRNA ligase [Gemmatimonadetes bacterium]|nr:glutamate--tRNA ligase [Gemmatimonadota bacterium]
MRLRFAPSPTGTLHVGGARTAVFNWLLARKHGGTFVLRIEDTDRERSTDESRDAILNSLTWLGLDWDEGPYFQSQRVDRHKDAARELHAGGHAYACFCTADELAAERSEAQAQKRNYVYSGRCRRLSRDESRGRQEAGEPHTIRFAVPPGRTEWDDLVHARTGFDNEGIGDFIVLRSDGGPIYNLAATIDDLDMRITHVVRGDDHISNTPRQILIYRALGAEPPRFGHVPLLFGSDRQKLSKRHGAQSVEEFRALGYLPQALVNFLALLGWSPGDDREVLGLPELIAAFGLERITGKSAIFETGKLEWLNGQHLARLTAEELARAVTPWLLAAGIATEEYLREHREWYWNLLEVLRPRARLLSDFVTLGRPYFPARISYQPEAVSKFWPDPSEAGRLLRELHVTLASMADFEKIATEARLRAMAEERGIAFSDVVHPLRVALTGMRVSPGIFEVLQLMGRELVLQRIEDAIWHLEGGSLSAVS